MAKIKFPKSLKKRLKDVARNHDLGSAQALADHLVERGLRQYDLPARQTTLHEQLDHVVAEQGYSSTSELIEHLLVRGLQAYEEPAASSEQLQERLRGLGYID